MGNSARFSISQRGFSAAFGHGNHAAASARGVLCGFIGHCVDAGYSARLGYSGATPEVMSAAGRGARGGGRLILSVTGCRTFPYRIKNRSLARSEVPVVARLSIFKRVTRSRVPLFRNPNTTGRNCASVMNFTVAALKESAPIGIGPRGFTLKC